jgi:SAM-dependent methyltransferase
MKNKLYVQYGCGWSAPEGWRNFDASPTLRFERLPLVGKLYTKNKERFPDNVEYGDIVKGLPIEFESCDGIYCSHVLEHLSLEDFRIALKNTYAYLKPGGIFRMVLPDLEFSINKYINDRSPEAAMNFLEETYLGVKTRDRGIKGLLYSLLGNSRHLWMWDYRSLSKELEDVGFMEIRRARYKDSKDPSFMFVDEFGRWEDCLGIECMK